MMRACGRGQLRDAVGLLAGTIRYPVFGDDEMEEARKASAARPSAPLMCAVLRNASASRKCDAPRMSLVSYWDPQSTYMAIALTCVRRRDTQHRNWAEPPQPAPCAHTTCP